MKLSTAIRIGSMTTKHITGRMWDGGNGRCALGAALDASGFVFKTGCGDPYLATRARFNIGWKCAKTIYKLNDMAGWSRDRIADYVEKCEEHDGYLQTGVTESKPLQQIAMEAI